MERGVVVSNFPLPNKSITPNRHPADIAGDVEGGIPGTIIYLMEDNTLYYVIDMSDSASMELTESVVAWTSRDLFRTDHIVCINNEHAVVPIKKVEALASKFSLCLTKDEVILKNKINAITSAPDI